MSASQEPRDGLSRTPWVASNAAIRFSMRTRSCTRNSRSRCGRFASSSSTDGTTTVRQAPGSPANFAAKTRRSPTASSRSVLARRAPRVTKMLVGSTTWLITRCAVRSRCYQNPSRPASKQLTTSVDASSGGSSRWRRPAMKASSPAPSPASSTMNLSLVVWGQTMRDDPGGRAQFDSEIDDLMANVRRHTSAPVPDVGPSQSGRGPGWIASQIRFQPASSAAVLRDEPSARAGSFMEWPAPSSGVVGSPAVQEEEWEWIFRSLASIAARMSARRSRVAVDVSPRHTLPYSRARSWVRLLVLLLKAWSLRGT
jgi:hypothetical protein